MSQSDWKPLVGKTKDGLEVVLRRFHPDDVERAGQWINTYEMRQVLQCDYPVSFQEELDWMNAKLPPNPTQIHLAICVNGQHVGGCGLHEISLRHRHATIGLMIGDTSVRRKGVATVVYDLLHRFAFTEMNLEALRADVYSHNEASQALHVTTGYELVGRIPRWYYKADDYRDLLIYHLAREKWRTLKV